MASGIVELLTGATLGELPPVVRSWVDEAELAADIRSRLDRAFGHVTDEKAAQAALDSLGLHQLSPLDVMSSSVETPDCMALCSVRFFGGDLSKPFLEVDGFATAPGREIPAIRDLRSAMTERYDALRPLALRFAHGPDTALGRALDRLGAEVDQYVYASPACNLTALGTPPPGVKVRAAADLSWYDTYLAEYAALLAERPSLQSVIEAEEQETISDAVAQGLCALVEVDDALCGVVVGRRGRQVGIPCVTIIERMLFARARGRGLGAHMIAGFAGLAAIGRQEVVSGSIAAGNFWSRVTAEKAGRLRIHTYRFIGLRDARRLKASPAPPSRSTPAR